MRAKKSLGQNFLVDGRVIERILEAFAPQEGETVIEIGPGMGALTSRLVGRVGQLFAVELDRELIPLLREKLGPHQNFILVEADALTLDLCGLVAPGPRARLIANLPYYISTAILQRLIEQRGCLSELVLMLQREVVERLTAQPSSAERGYLSVLVQFYCETEVLFDVGPGAFRPAPKVWSTVARLKLRESLPVEVTDEVLLWRVVSAGFAQRRKTLFNNLRHAPAPLRASIETRGGAQEILADAGVDGARRAETLTLEEWAALSNALA
jgi:16S rRNA (adenine1518-N6/adenine1519-N6)-dimethyltransferase